MRGNAPQVYEKYMSLGRDATSVGDRVIAESFYQFAEHYYRIMNDSTDPERRNNEYPRQVREQPQNAEDTNPGWGNGRGTEPASQRAPSTLAGSPAQSQPTEPQAAEQTQVNRSLGEQPRAEQPRAEQPQAEQPQAEQLRTERPRVGRPRIARSRTEQPRTEQPRTEQPRTEQPQIEQPQAAPSPVEQSQDVEPPADSAPGTDDMAPTEYG